MEIVNNGKNTNLRHSHDIALGGKMFIVQVGVDKNDFQLPAHLILMFWKRPTQQEQLTVRRSMG
jgi:hypothetical protein